MSFVEILKVVVLGLVEGFTEWLPISSTGHIILVDEIIKLDVSQAFKDVFDVWIQLGAMLAVVVLYFPKLNPFDKRKKPVQRRATLRLWLKILIACFPAAVVGLLVNDWVDANLKKAGIIAVALILYGILFIGLENKYQFKEFSIRKTGQLTGQTALYIGLFQLLSIVPGTSRSGVTILGAMALGCSRAVAAEFSFFLGIPVMIGASLLKMFAYVSKYGFTFTPLELFYLLLGMAIAFVVSIYSIKFLMGYIKTNDFKFFGYYRIVLGVIVVFFFLIRAIAGGAAG